MRKKHVGMKTGKKTGIMHYIFLGIMIITGIGVVCNPAFVNAKQVVRDEYITSDDWITPAIIHDEDSVPAINKMGAYESSFDSRKQGWITPVKDQGNYETCWSFASAAVIEANLIKNGYAGKDIDISENSIAYFFYNRQTDTLGYTKGDYNMIARSGYDYLTASGTLQGTGIALYTGAGIHTESQSPYLSIPSESLCYQGDYAVKTVYIYNYNSANLNATIDKVKGAIKEHGAVAAGMYFSASYYDKSKASYYTPISSANHAITIVGWDDSYSKDNFTRKPSRDGAWIIKNSYGKAFGNDGYFYISYEDKSLAELMSFEMIPKTSMYNNCYQYDGSGNPAYAYNSAEWYANVFKAKGAGGNNEELKAVSIFTLSTGTNYELQIYTGLSKASKPTAGTKAFTTTVKGTLTEAGYQMIELPEPVSLTAGEYFSVVIKLKTISGANAYVGVDTSYLNPNNDWIRFISASAKNQSFIKVQGSWKDLGKGINTNSGLMKANIRIKAYTDATQTKSNFHLSSSNLGVSKGDSQGLKLLVAEHVHRKVTWKSSNSSIASVNIAGKVKGKKYGTTTISGTFIGGSNKKTLKCKVTVGPQKIKGFNVGYDGTVKVSWKKNSNAAGYEVYYAAAPDGKYIKLAAINNSSKTSCSKQLAPGVYYIKMRPYRKSGKKKLYGSFTAVKEIIAQ